jgi:hypothetical protein
MTRVRSVLRGGVVLAAVLLAACSGGSDMDMSPGAIVSGGRDVAKEQETLRRFAAVQVCPEVSIREGTEALRRYERGKQDDPAALQYQGTLRTFARECQPTADGGTVVRVGVAGRLISGPTGYTGPATLPLRVVLVKNGSEVLYSQIHPVAATFGPGQASLPWSQVVEGITIPVQDGTGSIRLYVGFDDQATPAAG